MLQAQIQLGQRLREAHTDAMERKEKMLDQVMEGQVELGSLEMDDFLASVDPWWAAMDDEEGRATSFEQKGQSDMPLMKWTLRYR